MPLGNFDGYSKLPTSQKMLRNYHVIPALVLNRHHPTFLEKHFPATQRL